MPRIRTWVEQNKDELISLVSEMVKFDTINQVSTGTEKQAQLLVEKVMHDMSLETTVYSPDDVPGFHEHPAYFPGKDYRDRPNVLGKWKGSGKGKSLIFSSHIDTALIAPGWSRDPLEAKVEGNRLYGLGTFDMKGGLAASIMAVKCLQSLGLRPLGDVLIESVVDEEFGGANGTLAGRLHGGNVDAAIIPEPSNLAVSPATMGGALWRVTFRGRTGRSFSGESIVNPAFAAAKFMNFLEEFAEARSRANGPAPYYEQASGLALDVTRVEAGDMSMELLDVSPTECHVDIWVECYPGVTEEALKQELIDGFKAKYGSETPDLEFRKMIRFLPGSEVDPDFPLVQQLASEVTEVTGQAAEVRGAPFACDAFMFNIHSETPAIVLGPKGENAHAPDEYVDLDSLCQLTEIYARTIVSWCGLDQK